MAKKKKYYVVWHGLKPGIYDRWSDCEQQIKGFGGAVYAGFETKADAEQALNSDPWLYIKKKGEIPSSILKHTKPDGPQTTSLAVDAACSGNPGKMEYQGVFTDTGTLIFHQGPFKQATNNIGEFLALVHALAWLKKRKLDMPVYSDSENAILWVKNKRVNTKLRPGDNNKDVFDLINRALNWLRDNEYNNPVLKWNTAEWGEIPADFGRK